jgi:ATP-dependent helicase YprA (DUF1998 family)
MPTFFSPTNVFFQARSGNEGSFADVIVLTPGHVPRSMPAGPFWGCPIKPAHSGAYSQSTVSAQRVTAFLIFQATNEIIEEVEASKAFFEVYEGSIYMHQGKTYIINNLDLETKVAKCREITVRYYTKVRKLFR